MRRAILEILIGKIQPPPKAGKSVKSTSSSAADPFIVSEKSSSQAYASVNSSTYSSIDELDVFAMGGQLKNSNSQSDIFHSGNATVDLDSIFNSGSKSSNASMTKDPVYDSLFQNQKSSKQERGSTVKKTGASTVSMTRGSSPTNSVDDFLFFGETAPSSAVFQEVEGESEERRKARLKQHMRTRDRMAKALAEKNQRDLQTQQEQDERHRVADTMNNNIKRWAAGKEGNLRALLSSLHYVLWPECGW